MPHAAGVGNKLKLRLYVAGKAPNSLIAITNINAICAEHFRDAYELEIVDLLQQPGRCAADRVIMTPTLLRLTPLPLQLMIGNLSNTAQVLTTLADQ